MMKMDNPQYILNEINKGIKMGMDSISTISEKVGDQQFKDELLFQYDKYNWLPSSYEVPICDESFC